MFYFWLGPVIKTAKSSRGNLPTLKPLKMTEDPKTHRELLSQICSLNNEVCMSNACDLCRESSIWDVSVDSNPDAYLKKFDTLEAEIKASRN